MTLTTKCAASSELFSISEDEVAFYTRLDLPIPNLSPAERKRRRLAWSTFRTLHRRVCDGTGKSILSMYAPDAKHPVYHSDYWWSDNWDALNFGRAFDFGRPFFDQFDELLTQVPVLHQSVLQSENCEYINMAGHCKNCYLSFFLDYCEDCLYLQDANHDRSCVDCLGVTDSELCYECVDCTRGYNLLFSQRCVSCHDSYFLTDCRGCNHCIGCCNLVNKDYHIFNKPVSPKAYEDLKNVLTSRKKITELSSYIEEFSAQFPKRYYFGHSNDGFSGDNVRHLRNSFECFHSHELENVRYADYFFATHNSMDVSLYGNKSEWLYNCLKTGDQCSNDICCLCCWSGSSNNAYCHLVIGTKDCFGCSALKQKQYCILNKQYSADEYHRLRAKIVAHMKETGEWGQFFPMQLSPFPYNESIAQVYFPLSKRDVLRAGLLWREESSTQTTGTLPPSNACQDLPDDIQSVSSSLLERPLNCARSGRAYKITAQELRFYKDLRLPLPVYSPEVRHEMRFAKRNPLRLYKRVCTECQAELETTYPPNRCEKVLCEHCYQIAVE